MSELRALRERVEKAEGPDRNLDIDVMRALVDATKAKFYWQWRGLQTKGAPEPDPQSYWDKSRTPMLTASIDAVVALIERLIPAEKRFFWQVGVCSIRDGRVVSYSADANWTGEKEFEAKTPAIALLAALLAALESTNE